jgi:hypothetical protein
MQFLPPPGEGEDEDRPRSRVLQTGMRLIETKLMKLLGAADDAAAEVELDVVARLRAEAEAEAEAEGDGSAASGEASPSEREARVLACMVQDAAVFEHLKGLAPAAVDLAVRSLADDFSGVALRRALRFFNRCSPLTTPRSAAASVRRGSFAVCSKPGGRYLFERSTKQPLCHPPHFSHSPGSIWRRG